MDCTVATISNHTNGFAFDELFNVYLYLNQTCPSESDIFFPGTRMLTEFVCKTITGTSSSIWSGWTPYPISDIWTRIVTWKLPLFQLVSQFPRPPLGLSVETATIVHFLGDPIDSVTSMLLTLSMCSARAKQAKQICCERGLRTSDNEYHCQWKALAIIMVSYDECGLAEKADDICREYKELRVHTDFDGVLRHIYDETAYSLAADRSTKTLPVAMAEIFFVTGWLIALLKAASSEPNPMNWVNVEAQSVAISANYLWVTSAVGMGSVIGVSQSEGALPRLLQGFEYHMASFRDQGDPARRPSAEGRVEMGWCRVGIDRAMNGGVYSWRSTKWRDIPTQFNVDTRTMILYAFMAFFMVGSSLLTAALLSYFVAPRGPNCRHIPETMMFALWVMSFVLGGVLERWLRKGVFWTIFWKDTLFTIANLGIVLVVQWGIMNRCSCWSMWGLVGLHLPQMPEVEPELMNYIRHIAPWITFMAILFQLLFCAAVACKYWDAVRVFVQRDDGVSNLGWQKAKVETKAMRHDKK